MTDRDLESTHLPVLLEEVVNFLQPERGGLFVDATLGLGGHAQAILAAGPQTEVLGIDQDSEALNRANQRLTDFRGRYHLVHANFAEIGEIAAQKGVQSVRGILADLGVSSLQFDSADRGFSFQREGPLDMRMNREADLTAGRSDQLLWRERSGEPDLYLRRRTSLSKHRAGNRGSTPDS